MAGKGDWRRPSRVSQEEVDANWDRIFKKKPQQGPGKSQVGADNTVKEKPSETVPKP